MPGMFPPLLHRLTAWLCLAVALFSGLAPAQGFVLCLEPDGCLTLEVAAGTDKCGSCEPHRDENAQAACAALAATGGDCPCIDFTVQITTKDQRVQPKRIDAPLLKWLVVRPSYYAEPHVTASLASCAPLIDAPRPADSLLLIRTVVLLV